MNDWQQSAIQWLPQERELIEFCDSSLELWACLWPRFVATHREPRDRDTIRGIYDFAEWCLNRSEDEDTISTTLINFFEDLPDAPSVWDEIPHHMTREQFVGTQEIFKYGKSPQEHGAFMQHVLQLFDGKGKKDRSP